MQRLLLHSPLALLLVEYEAEGLRAIRFWPQGKHPPAGTRDAPADALGRAVVRELGEYFAGERRAFALPLLPGGTPFQRSVWDALQRIPFGETRSYGALARDLGRPGAARAVGQANGRNPLPIVVPCHRVLASDGGIGGYLGVWGEGSGVGLKRWLLEHERRDGGAG